MCLIDDVLQLVQPSDNINTFQGNADSSNIMTQFSNLINPVVTDTISNNTGDLLFMSFSGHGFSTSDITPTDEARDNTDELIVGSMAGVGVTNTNNLPGFFIRDDDINTTVRTLQTGVNLFAVIDSCHSGTFFDLRYQYYNTDTKDTYTENPKVPITDGNIIMLSGCTDAGTSADAYINGIPQGALTWAFLKSIENKTDITWRQLILLIRALLKFSGFKQIPQLSSGRFINLDTKVWFM